jgi:hypothetical protein
MSEPEAATIALHRGAIRVSAGCYARFFAGVDSVVLLYAAEERRLWVLPVRAANAGGFLLKQVNARGDRSAAAHGFFRDHDISEKLELVVAPRWDAARQGIAIDLAA